MFRYLIKTFSWGFFLLMPVLIFMGWLVFVWSPGSIVTDGRNDYKTNGIWLQHGWLGDNDWFTRNEKNPRLFRDKKKIKNIRNILQNHHITDLFLHLCPSSPRGAIPGADSKQTDLFLMIMKGFRVMPWVGGVLDKHVFLSSPEWRANFINSILHLFINHPNFAGVHINIEPLPSGNNDFLRLLDELRGSLPEGKLISVAAFPPSTLWHPYSEVHWQRTYFEEVSRKADQMVVMMYDTAIPFEKLYCYLMASWTRDILVWAGKTEVLLGVPAYEDAVGYHNPKVENIKNALMGIHAGLSSFSTLPKNYQGIAIYSEWEMDENEWEYFKKNYQRIK